MAVASTTNATSLTNKKARIQKITKKGPGIFVECGKVRLGKSEDWSEVDDIGLTAFKDEPPQIGLWGIVKNGSKPFKEIAEQVYGDAGKAKFILEANKIHKDAAFEGQWLYIPNLNYNRLKESNAFVNSNYYFTHADVFSFKPIIQVSGDVYIHYDCAYVSQRYYAGKDYSSKLVASEEMTFKEFHEGIVANANSLNEMKVDNYGPAVKDTGVAIKNQNEMKYFKRKIVNGKLYFRIDKNLKSLPCEPSWGRWIGYNELAKRMFKVAFTKGTIIFSLVIAGIKTWLDWEKNKNPKHAVITFIKEGVKAAISTVAGVGAALAITAIFVPGPGWVVAALIIGSMGAGLILDSIDEYTEKKGYQKWAK